MLDEVRDSAAEDRARDRSSDLLIHKIDKTQKYLFEASETHDESTSTLGIERRTWRFGSQEWRLVSRRDEPSS